MKLKKNKGILFWITGLSGSGKTTIGKKFYIELKKKFKCTVFFNGDDLRNIFKLNKYDAKSRKKYALSYCKLCKTLTDQGINVIFTTVSMYEDIRLFNKKNIKNYFEIYIKTNISKIIKLKKKKIYSQSNNIIGIHIKPELPKKSDIIIKNNFLKKTDDLAMLILKKLEKKLTF